MLHENQLTNLELGKQGKIISISSSCRIKRRLQDLGMIEGTIVECVAKSPSGNPIAYQIRGAVIALRKEDTEYIIFSQI